jgi:hypothetical protein
VIVCLDLPVYKLDALHLINLNIAVIIPFVLLIKYVKTQIVKDECALLLTVKPHVIVNLV